MPVFACVRLFSFSMFCCFIIKLFNCLLAHVIVTALPHYLILYSLGMHLNIRKAGIRKDEKLAAQAAGAAPAAEEKGKKGK